MMEFLGLLSVVAFILLLIALVKPEHHVLNKLPFFDGKSKSVRRLLVVGYYFAALCLLSVAMTPFLSEKKINADNQVLVKEQEPKVKKEAQFITIKTADDAVLSRYKNIYNKLMSFKDSPNFHAYGFGKGGNYYGWYLSARNFTEEEDSYLMQTYGFVSGDLLMLGQEYLKSKGKETDYSHSKREEFEKVFSSEMWEVLK